MSGHKYITNPNSLFADDDDVDDETFLKNSRAKPNPSTNPFADQQQQAFEEKIQKIQERTLESSQRSLGLLRETEEVGIATAGELSKQREQLEKSSRQIDEISAKLRFSQKHINGLKGIFSQFKNYLSGNTELSPRMTSSTSGSKISEEVKVQSPTSATSPDELYDSHPINRLRSDNVALREQISCTNGFNQALEENLDEMCGSLSRLKGLAIDMQSEIVSQNDLLDNMNYKFEDVDIVMQKQNKEMNKMLGKK